MKGIVPQAKSRTAILGYLAARAAGQTGRIEDVVDWLEARGIAVGLRGLRDAVSARGTGSHGHEDPMEEGWFSEVFDFDPVKLDLELAMVVFPAPEHASRLLDDLRATKRLLRSYRSYEGDLVALLAYAGAKERRLLQTHLEERQPDLRWLVIREVDDSSAASALLALAHRAAQSEGLLAKQAG
jgi:hypothetical protein